ncbi:MAG: TauD/TfdA family dioxygenase [Methylovulum sp.]
MTEYYNNEQLEFLVKELRQHPVDVTSPNISDIQEKFSVPSLNTVSEIKKLLIKHNYLIIRGFGTPAVDAITLAKLLSKNIFYQGDDLKYVYQFETQPFQTKIFSSSLSCGAFHTDFWTIDNPPNYILLQCVEPDPKHPFYSRNQVVLLLSLLERLEELIPNITSTLLNLSLPHRVKNQVLWIKLLEAHENNLMIRIHPNYIDENSLEPKHYIDGVAVHHLISNVAQSISHDFVLNSGDILIVSNKSCLHRRNEATVIFEESLSQWKGRKLNTLRFF